MDELDQKIMGYLRKDARMAFSEIAKLLKVSEGTIRNRVERLVEEGEITRFTIESLPRGVEAWIALKCNPHQPTDEIVRKLLNVSGIEKVFEVTGRFDVICLSQTNDMPRLNSTLEEIRKVNGVLESECFTVLKKS